MVTKFTGDGLWFTSDTHFGHQAIIRLCERPFSDITDQDKKLIENWNSVVKQEDTVFHLGDFCFGGFQKWKDIRDQLNGHIILILGNHDFKNITQGIINLFDYTSQQMRITVDGRMVYLNHCPFLTFAHGCPDIYNEEALAYQAFGHVHSRVNNTGYDAGRLQYLYPTQYDVGVDNNNFTPISWKEFDEKIKQQILSKKS